MATMREETTSFANAEVVRERGAIVERALDGGITMAR